MIIQTLFLSMLVGNLAVPLTHEEALERARRVLENYPLVDGHNDLAHQYRKREDNNVEAIDLTQNLTEIWENSHTDIPRMRAGQMGAQFWSVYISCTKQYLDVVRATMEQYDVVNRMMDLYPEDFEFVTTAQGIEDAFAEGKIGGLMGLEGGHSIDSSLGALRVFYEMGTRYMTLTHNCDTPWADANGEGVHGGLTGFGRVLIREMNRLGMLIDLSHVSFDTMREAIQMSDAPVMFSHSNPWSMCNHNRNVPDDVLDMLVDNRGIIMITFVTGFLTCAPSSPPSTVSLVADHIEYVRDRIGYDYIGIGSDYDGISTTPEGLEDTSKFPNLFAELVSRGWSDENLEKLAGRNMVRVFREVEQVRDDLSSHPPYSDLIDEEDIPEEHECRTGFATV